MNWIAVVAGAYWAFVTAGIVHGVYLHHRRRKYSYD